MNPANYKLSKEVLNDMIQHEYDQKFHWFQSEYGTKFNSLSPNDQSQKALDEFFVRLSEPLKKMQVEYLKNAGNNCYKDKHINDTFTNLEQILVCKEQERQKVFGKFDQMYVSHRDATRFRYQDCSFEANNNIERAVQCIRDYIKDIRKDNEEMVELYKKDYAKYM